MTPRHVQLNGGRMRRMAVVGLVSLLMLGCARPLGVGLVLEIVDVETADPRAFGAVVRLTGEDAWEETIRGSHQTTEAGQTGELTGAAGYTGLLDIVVEHEGYETWRREGVRIEGQRRGLFGLDQPRTKRVRVELERSGEN